MHPDRRLLTVELVAAPVLALGLMALAILQYHWLDQWRQREAESRQAALQTLTKGLAARIDAVVEQQLQRLRALADEAELLDLSAPRQHANDSRSTPVLWVAADPGTSNRPIWRLDPQHGRFVQAGYAELAQIVGARIGAGPAELTATLSEGSAPLLLLRQSARISPDQPQRAGLLIAALPSERIQAVLDELDDSEGDYALHAQLRPEPITSGLPVPSSALFAGQPAAGYWHLQLNYRAGSASELATRLQRRNLAVAAVILLLLAASSALLWIAARSRRRLAQQRLTMVAAVSHELRTPLSVIDSAAANLADGITREAASVVEYGRLIRDQSQRLRSLVEHALAPGVLADAGRRSLAQATASAALSEVLASCLDKLEALQARQRLRCSGPLPVLAVAAADLELMLSNLIANALRYSGPTTEVRLQTQTRGRWMDLNLSNDCSGLLPDERAQLLEPFFRGRQARCVHQEGSGLGLNLIQAISHRYGGRLRYGLRQDEIRFVLRLPLLTRAASPRKAQSEVDE